MIGHYTTYLSNDDMIRIYIWRERRTNSTTIIYLHTMWGEFQVESISDIKGEKFS